MNGVIKSWNDFYTLIMKKDYSISLKHFLDDEYSHHVCYPPRELIFNAFNLCPLNKVKIVILGQDPYHEPGQAMGLAFSVPSSIVPPPSLLNIFKEIENEFHMQINKNNGDLTYLSKQGVLLLNAILSVREHQALSHNIPEYKLFLLDVLKCLNDQDQPIVFMLWGNKARQLKKVLTNSNHLILESNHPSPLSANQGGWFHNNHFVKANNFLISKGLTAIDWINK